MKTKIMVASIVVLLCSSSLLYASATKTLDLSKLFQEIVRKEQKLLAVPDEAIVAEHPDFQITVFDLKQRKANVEFMGKMADLPHTPSNEELVKTLIKRELLVLQAKELGLSVSQEELTAHIDEQKNMITQINEVREVLRELVKKSRAEDEDAYWNLPETQQLYEEWLLVNKLITVLYEQGQLSGQVTIQQYEDVLYEENREQITIDTDILKQVIF